MGLWGRIKAAASTLWRGPLVEASLEELYGRPVPWEEYYLANGRFLSPVSRYGPDNRPEKNATVRTLQDHDRVRNESRILAETNPNAIGLLQRLQAYNVGKGSSTEVQSAEEDSEPPKRLAGKVRQFVKDFKKQGVKQDQWPAIEKEMVWRLHVDGEFFLRFFPQKDGLTVVRFVEPQCVRPPMTGEDAEGEWSYGIQTPDGDVLKPTNYCVHDFRAVSDEIVDAVFVIHAKINCLSTQKRGIPSLYACADELRDSAKLRKATRDGEKNRACITYFRRHKAASADAIRAMQSQHASVIMQGPQAGELNAGNESQVYVEILQGPSVVDIPEGLDPLPPPGSPNVQGSSASVDQANEAVAARFGCPVWIVSGKSEGGNFAQSLTAESPFTVTIQDSQAALAELSDACQTKALEIGAEQGLLPEDVLEQVDLLVSFPSPVSRNKLEETNRRKILHDDNIMSETTWSTEEGLDPAKQKQQMLEERADPILPLPTKVPSVPVDPQTGEAAAGNGKPPSSTPAARYAQLTGPLREQYGLVLELLRRGHFPLVEQQGAALEFLGAIAEASQRREGESWETNGRKYKRTGGKTVRVGGEKEVAGKKTAGAGGDARRDPADKAEAAPDAAPDAAPPAAPPHRAPPAGPPVPKPPPPEPPGDAAPPPPSPETPDGLPPEGWYAKLKGWAAGLAGKLFGPRPEPQVTVREGQRNFASPTDSEAVKGLLDGSKDYPLSSGLGAGGTDPLLDDVLRESGRSGKPKVVDKAGMDALRKKGWKVAYRGVRDARSADEFRRAETHNVGTGIYGNGTYFDSNKDEKRAEANARGYGGDVIVMALPPDARVAKKSKLEKEQLADLQKLDADYKAKKIDRATHEKLRETMMDLGRYAALENYDALDVDNRGYLVLLNRGIVAVEAGGDR